MISAASIEEVAERIVREFNPESIILFGSHAYGTPGPDSDVDLLVVLPFEGRGWRMAAEILKQAKPPFPMDLLVRTPEQVEERLRVGDVLINRSAHPG
jgi:predicted nucleotidyltransferase